MNSKCSVCHEVKDSAAFFKAAKSKTGCSNRCRSCEAEYRKTRKEQKREYAKAYTSSPAYKQRRKDKRREATLLRLKIKKEAFAEITNKDIRRWRTNAAARYIARLQATPKWTAPEQKQRMLAIYAATQQLQELTATVYHVDHIVPLRNEQVCGLHVWWNLQPMTERDNVRKQNIFDPALIPEQGMVAFPDGAGPTSARFAVLKKVEQSDE
jgi:hypothetical protein